MLFGNSVQEYYLSEVRKIYAARKARLAAIKTKAQARAYVKEVREKIRNALDEGCFEKFRSEYSEKLSRRI